MKQFANLIAAPSRLIKGDLFLSSASLVLFLNLADSNSVPYVFGAETQEVEVLSPPQLFGVWKPAELTFLPGL